MSAGSATQADFDAVASAIRERLSRNERVRRNLPGGGRIRLDRQLPFLCVYRTPVGHEDLGTRELVTTEAAYLFASGDAAHHAGVVRVCEAVASISHENFGVFLLLELWADDEAGPGPLAFRLVTPEPESIPSTIEALTGALSQIDLDGQATQVTVDRHSQIGAPGREPLASAGSLLASGATVVLGLAIRPVYRDRARGVVFPLVLERLRRQLATAVRQGVFAFSGRAGHRGAHFDAFGPSALTQAAREADQQLEEVAAAFDFLRKVTPVNADEAWEEFRRSGFRRAPDFRYRPLPYHPSLLKRRLFEAPIERVEDPTLALLLEEKQVELDRQLTALREIDTQHFLYESLQLYGGVEDELRDLAQEILRRLPARKGGDAHGTAMATAAELASEARREIGHYRKRISEFNADVIVADDVASGMIVVRDQLFVSSSLAVRRERVAPLLHHEVGTHLLTYFNGRRQSLAIFAAGLAGYESLQEGLAVLAEYLTGGLTAARLRSLAARVLAVRAVIEGATFAEVFHELSERQNFAPRSAFTTVLRAFRAGGLTKDAIYLRGFRDLLDYLRAGHDVEPLYIGKIGLQHVPYVRELRRRGVLGPPGVLPRFWQDPQRHDRLDAFRRAGILELVEAAR
jgi:uncharacterized protein (TIGR02421 family)